VFQQDSMGQIQIKEYDLDNRIIHHTTKELVTSSASKVVQKNEQSTPVVFKAFKTTNYLSVKVLIFLGT
jgi:phenylpyruvate tautomerase PptA (4-oxalocrotonate tautomerase family)